MVGLSQACSAVPHRGSCCQRVRCAQVMHPRTVAMGRVAGERAKETDAGKSHHHRSKPNVYDGAASFIKRAGGAGTRRVGGGHAMPKKKDDGHDGAAPTTPRTAGTPRGGGTSPRRKGGTGRPSPR